MLPTETSGRPRKQPRLVPSLLSAPFIAALIYLLLYGADYVLPYPLVLAVCTGVLLLRWALGRVGEPDGLLARDLVRPVRVRRRLEPGEGYEGGDGVAEAVRRWDRRLGWGEKDGPRFAVTVGRALGDLVDERLRQRHGITRATDPARARELVGERMWALLGPLQRSPTPRQIVAALDELEREETQ
jgi:hypothetical protein